MEDLHNLTIKDLKAVAKQYNIPRHSKITRQTKDEFIAKILEKRGDVVVAATPPIVTQKSKTLEEQINDLYNQLVSKPMEERKVLLAPLLSLVEEEKTPSPFEPSPITQFLNELEQDDEVKEYSPPPVPQTVEQLPEIDIVFPERKKVKMIDIEEMATKLRELGEPLPKEESRRQLDQVTVNIQKTLGMI